MLNKEADRGPTAENQNHSHEKQTGSTGALDKHNVDSGVGEMMNADALALDGTIVNASGHRDQLQRHYGFFSICGLALSVDNAWVAVGTSLNVAICNTIQYTSWICPY